MPQAHPKGGVAMTLQNEPLYDHLCHCITLLLLHDQLCLQCLLFHNPIMTLDSMQCMYMYHVYANRMHVKRKITFLTLV